MNNPSTTREALILEALGEAARLIRQVEALAPALDESCQTLAEARGGLAGQLATFQAQILALTEKAKVQAVRHILASTDDAVEAQAQAMAMAANRLFDSRVDPRIQQLVSVIARQVERLDHPWELWLTHAATALVSCVATLAITVHF